MKECVAVYMLDVGQGDCTVVRLPDRRVVVFDCKDDHVLRKVLVNWGMPQIAAFVLSHLDQDHISGALQFLQGYPGSFERVCLSTDRDVSSEHEDAKRAKALIDYAVEQDRDEGARRRRWELLPNSRDPRPLVHGQGWSVTLLAPPHGQILTRQRDGAREEANRYSSILRIEVGVEVLPARGGGHEVIVDDWLHPLCRPPDA